MQQPAPTHSVFMPQQQGSLPPHERKHSARRQKVKLSIWVETPEKTELERLAKNNGLSVSETGRKILVDGIRQRLRLEREVLAMPILEAFFDKKMNQVVNRLAEFLGRIASEQDTKKKEALQKAFYQLLDTSQKETVKAVKHWNPNIIDVVAAIKARLKGEPI
jgi:hypothetical protein